VNVQLLLIQRQRSYVHVVFAGRAGSGWRGYWPTLQLVSIYDVLAKYNFNNSFLVINQQNFRSNNLNAGVSINVPIYSAKPPFDQKAVLDTGPITNHVNFANNRNGKFAYVTIGGTSQVKIFQRGPGPTLVATIPTGETATEAPASVQLHAGGAQVITAHADGTRSVRSIGAAPVDLGASSDVVALRFYASGVRDGSEIRVQIAGHDVPVLYAGPADHFAGLDEVTVKVPHSLAGSGNVDVELTVDGRSASPVHIQIQ